MTDSEWLDELEEMQDATYREIVQLMDEFQRDQSPRTARKLAGRLHDHADRQRIIDNRRLALDMGVAMPSRWMFQ